jgi:signal transduction histidine kinase
MTAVTRTDQLRLAALYEVSARLGTTLNLDELLTLVMDSIIQLTGAERGVLLLRDGYGELGVRVARQMGEDGLAALSPQEIEISQTVVQRAMDGRRGVLTDNAQEDERFALNASVVGYQLRSLMCAPLLVHGRVIGAAYVDNRLQVGTFTTEDLTLLEMFSTQAAMALENARLFQATDAALTRRVEELTLFQQIDRQLNDSLKLDEVLRSALAWAARLTDADGGAIGLLELDEAGEQWLRFRVQQGAFEANSTAVAIPMSHPTLAQLAQNLQTMHMTQVTAEQALDGTPAAVQLVVPILRHGVLLGVIALESHLVTQFLAEDIAFVSRLADRTAVAVHNSQLYTDLEEAHHARAHFISLVTHELRLPLTSMRGYADLLMGGLAGQLSDQQKSMVGIIRRNADRMNALISDLSDINRAESQRLRLELEPLDLRHLLEDVSQTFAKQLAEKELIFRQDVPENVPLVLADRTRTLQVLENLISNAYKYTPMGREVVVKIEVKDTAVWVHVHDKGIGISEADQDRLFEQFFRSENPAVREQTGWGLGLSVVKLLVELQGGQIVVSSLLGVGSTFSFSLPIAPQ